MTLKDEILVIKNQCGKIALGNGKCWICNCITSKKGMVLHHRWYLTKDDVIHDQYLPRNDTNTLQYYTDLLPLIKKNPKRFMYMCNTDHQSLTRFIRYGDKKFKQLCLARKMSHKR